MRLKHEPSLASLHNPAKKLFLNRELYRTYIVKPAAQAPSLRPGRGGAPRAAERMLGPARVQGYKDALSGLQRLALNPQPSTLNLALNPQNQTLTPKP